MAKSDIIISNEIMAEIIDHSDEYQRYKDYVNNRSVRDNKQVDLEEPEYEMDER